jgi:methylated-DNA-[protein]-cysteine S-methyltransferase
MKQKFVHALFLPATRERVRARIHKRYSSAKPDPSCGGSLARSLGAFFKGRAVTFQCSIDWTRFSEFDRNCFLKTTQIPYGKVSHYGKIASQAGYKRAARAIGSALGRNPLPVIIPCHRVIPAHGRDTGGFSGGKYWKNRLLDLEKKT